MSNQLNIVMNLGNAAFEDDPGEVARILRDLADKVENGVSEGDEFVLRDINGNKVGKAEGPIEVPIPTP